MSAPLRFVTAVHRYDAASATQVSFVPGERLAVLAQIDEHWYPARYKPHTHLSAAQRAIEGTHNAALQ